jgi:hypothetical protein
MLGHNGFEFPKLDPVTSDFHLIVKAPQVFERPILR